MGNVKTAQNQQLRPLAGLEIRLLGPITVRIGGEAVTVPSKKARALLAYLVQREGVEVARTTLTGLLWGEREEAQARASLRQSLSELRGTLGAAGDAIEASKESITWRAGAAQLDTRTLERAAKSEESAALAEAATLFTGEFVEGLAVDEPGFDEWVTAERERLRLLAASVGARLMKSAEESGRLEEAISHGIRLLGLDPLQEHVYRSLMRLYAAQGRPDAALAQYERCERELSKQLGVKPEAETEALARSIRASRRETAAKIESKPGLPLPNKPSVTVLAFTNLSSEREHGFFADGLTQDIITALSQIRDLVLVANSVKATPASNADLARELGVRFILEGSVRASGTRIRVTAHLIDGTSGAHVWAERYEGDVVDIFAVQDQITLAIALAMQVNLTAGDKARFAEGQTRNLRAWEKMVAARDAFGLYNRTSMATARRLLEDALQLDPNYTGAIVRHGMTHWWDARFNKAIDAEDSLRRAETDSQRALGLNPDFGPAFMLKSGIAFLRDQHDQAIKLAERAVNLAPSDSDSVAFLAMLYMYSGEHEKSLTTLEFAIRLCPQCPDWYTYYQAFSHMWTGNFTKARELAESYLRQMPDEPVGYTLMTTILAFQNRKKEAAEMMTRLRARFPDFGMTEMRMSQRYREPADFEKIVRALREAGLPD
jgi:DNA-binding SARP family transcriptional activator/Tfp pilus assembly protein PilF